MEKTLSPFAPPIQHKFAVDARLAEKRTLDNGSPVYFTGSSENELSYLLMQFECGRVQETSPLQAQFALSQIKNGTSALSSKEVFRLFDRSGASFYTQSHLQYSEFQLYCLEQQSEALYPLINELILDAKYEEEECSLSISRALDEYRINQERVDYLAAVEFNNRLFGAEHPRGRITEERDFEQLRAQQLRDYHKQYLRNGACRIICSMAFSEERFQRLNRYFGQREIQGGFQTLSLPVPNSAPAQRYHREREGLQTAIVAGCHLYDEGNPDEVLINVVNFILGGYFGSRLMSNIRERNGFTYGIRSSIVQVDKSYFLDIRTECGSEFVERVFEEIKNEYERLANELISEDELQKVKQYMNSFLLKYQDGPFASTENCARMLRTGHPFDYWKRFNDQLWAIGAEDVYRCMNNYFHFSKLLQVTVG